MIKTIANVKIRIQLLKNAMFKIFIPNFTKSRDDKGKFLYEYILFKMNIIPVWPPVHECQKAFFPQYDHDFGSKCSLIMRRPIIIQLCINFSLEFEVTNFQFKEF